MYVEILSIYVFITTARNSFSVCLLMRILLICVDAETGRSVIDERSVPCNIRKESWKSMTQILLKQNNCQAGYSELRRITEFNLKRFHFPPMYLSISLFLNTHSVLGTAFLSQKKSDWAKYLRVCSTLPK